MIPSSLQRSGAFVLRKFTNTFGAAALIGSSARGSTRASAGPSLLATVIAFAFVLLLPIVALAALALALHLDPQLASVTLATAPGMAMVPAKQKPANIRQMEAEFKRLAKELEIGQTEMANGPIPQARGEELELMAKEMESLQTHLDQYNRVAGIVKKSREVDSPTLPTDRSGNEKRLRTTPGHLFIASEAFRLYRQTGKQGWSAHVDVKSRLGRPAILRGEEAVAFQAKAFDAGTLSDLGTDAMVQVDRDPEIVRFEEPEMLTIRDVLNVAQTTSDSVRYVRQTAITRAAAVQATRGAAKAYLDVTFAAATVSTETIAVLSKVTEQDIDDAPRLVGIINGEMALDVRVKEEQQLLWGTGSGGQITGLFTDTGVEEFDRAAVGDTVIDTIRKMRTDLRLRHVQPNFVLVDPIDWEAIELAKGTDDRYVWGMITDVRGPRIWSLRVVESDAMTNTVDDERRILMGDGIRGATIYDRHDIRLAVGYVDDDFARNLRTLRAEERLALAIKRPWAFEYAITQAATP